MQHVAVWCSVLQCGAACCSVMQRVAVWCSVLPKVCAIAILYHEWSGKLIFAKFYLVADKIARYDIHHHYSTDYPQILPHVSVWCSVLQCVAVCCSVSQCIAVSLLRNTLNPITVHLATHKFYSESQRVTMCCSVLQHVSVCCSQLATKYTIYNYCSSDYPQILPCISVCCNVLQCVAVCCSQVYSHDM